MDFEDVVRYFGRVQTAATALNLTRAGVYLWKQRGIPIATQCQIEIMTGGGLKADREKLMPFLRKAKRL